MLSPKQESEKQVNRKKPLEFLAQLVLRFRVLNNVQGSFKLRTFNFFSASLVAFALVGCGGGGGGSSTTTSPTPVSAGFSQTYTSSASAGELMTYSIDTTALTYSYTITKSSYGCEVATASCRTGSGTLIKNSDGTYSPSNSTGTKIFALQNGLMVGGVKLTLNGMSQVVPIVGVANPVTTLADLSGTFNYISLQCSGKTYGVFTGCGTSYGTVSIASNGTFTTCASADISAPAHTCSDSTTGALTSLGGGVWQFKASGPTAGATTNYFIAFKAPNGQTVGIVDFNDNLVYGYGQGVFSTKAPTTNPDVAGNYAWSNVYGQSGVVSINANGTTNTGLSLTPNAPWSGITTVAGGTGTGYGMIAGNGVYVYRNSTISAPYFEVGLKVQ